MTTTTTICLLVAILAATAGAPLAAGDDGTTHLRLYIHETFAGANATAVQVAASPLGANATYGTISVFDDELREGRGVVFSTLVTAVFTDGEYNGSTLVLNGHVDFGADWKAAAERPVVGGTGRFRLARGYSMMSRVGATSSTAVLKLDLYVRAGV